MTYRIIVQFDRFHFQSHCVVCTQLQRLGFKDTFHQGSSFCVKKKCSNYSSQTSRWTIRRSFMLPWFRTNTTKRNVGFSMVTLQVVCLIVHLNFVSSKLIRVNYHRNKLTFRASALRSDEGISLETPASLSFFFFFTEVILPLSTRLIQNFSVSLPNRHDNSISLDTKSFVRLIVHHVSSWAVIFKYLWTEA